MIEADLEAEEEVDGLTEVDKLAARVEEADAVEGTTALVVELTTGTGTRAETEEGSTMLAEELLVRTGVVEEMTTLDEARLLDVWTDEATEEEMIVAAVGAWT